jgi:D-tyrosyl-tRNA(Tyr) deacylase
MRAIVQRVSRAKVSIEGTVIDEIGNGSLVLIGIHSSDSDKVIKWMCNKITNLRIFPDDEGKMNRSVIDVGGGIMLISNFTLYGNAMKGFRPSFVEAAAPEIAEPIYNEMIEHLKKEYPVKIAAGVFGAMMDIELVNIGPVTISIEKS